MLFWIVYQAQGLIWVEILFRPVDGRRNGLGDSNVAIESSFNLVYDQVLEGDHIKDPVALESVFSGLDKGQPVVVYSKNGGRASLVWFALETAGYDARLYTWKDWLAHQG